MLRLADGRAARAQQDGTFWLMGGGLGAFLVGGALWTIWAPLPKLGGAEFASRQDLHRMGMDDPSGWPLGRHNGRRVYLPEGRQAQHLLVIGPPGMGKTISVLLPILLSYRENVGASLIIVDPKGDLMRYTSRGSRARAIGSSAGHPRILTPARSASTRCMTFHFPMSRSIWRLAPQPRAHISTRRVRLSAQWASRSGRIRRSTCSRLRSVCASGAAAIDLAGYRGLHHAEHAASAD